MTIGQTKKPKTRIQREKRILILDAGLDVFAQHGFRGATIDQIADTAKMSKPNLLYYFKDKEAIFIAVLEELFTRWIEPLRTFDENNDPIDEIRSYIRQKMEMTRDFPRESRLFANEILQGAPHILPILHDRLKPLLEQNVGQLQTWMDEGKLAKMAPEHLLFTIWATTQHYADFEAQIAILTGKTCRDETFYNQASTFVEDLFLNSLRPQ